VFKHIIYASCKWICHKLKFMTQMQFLDKLVWTKIKEIFCWKFICNLNLPQTFHDLIVQSRILSWECEQRFNYNWNYMKSYNCFVTFKITSFWFPWTLAALVFVKTKTLWAIGHFTLDFFFGFFKGLSTTWSFCLLVSDFALLEMHVCSSSSSFKNVVFSFGSS
jgi:hypothetical protein